MFVLEARADGQGAQGAQCCQQGEGELIVRIEQELNTFLVGKVIELIELNCSILSLRRRVAQLRD